MIALALVIIGISQVIGLCLIALALGSPAKTSYEVRQSAMIEPTISTDYGGMV